RSIRENRFTFEKEICAGIEVAKSPCFIERDSSLGKSIKEDSAAVAFHLHAKRLTQTRTGMRDNVVGKIFEAAACFEFYECVHFARLAVRAIDACGRRS